MPEASVPQYCPSPRELDDLELISHGALGDDQGFDGPEGLITLRVPDDVAGTAEQAGALELVDPEGLPLARVTVTQVVATEPLQHVVGPVQPLAHHEFGAFRRLYLSPQQVREQYAADTVTVPVAGPLTDQDLERIGNAAAGRPVLLLALVGHGTPSGGRADGPGGRADGPGGRADGPGGRADGPGGRACRDLTAPGLLRATLAAAERLPNASVVAVPLASRGDAEADHALGQRVVDAYAPGEVVGVTGEGELLDAVADVVAFECPEPAAQGLVVFFTGLSGSGKSTLARALHDVVLEQGERTVTSLDGDVVRRNLSAGLTFSKEDRETNIRRIGWVAAEISRHGGVAICSPIAPFDETRRQVREMVETAGGAFVLVHVATPLEECERRDRKGLYAKARAGQIPEFTGISSPYEEPDDAAVRVDTTGRSIEDALGDVLDHLVSCGYLGLDKLDQPKGLDQLDQPGGLDKLDQPEGLDKLDRPVETEETP